jgi:methylenetetrahydrofolate dehydrogenase (NADP+)/methenyltetrahydrofolate cyclohydrolase
VGKPLAAALANRRCRVSFMQRGDPEAPGLFREGDVLVTELFQKHAVKAEMLKPGAVVFDFGNNYEGKRVYGDVDTENAAKVASAITPVPGGIGPLLITMLLRNTLKAATRSCTPVGSAS